MTHATDSVRVWTRRLNSRTTLLLAALIATFSFLALAPARADAQCISNSLAPLAFSSFQGGDGDQCNSTGSLGSKDWEALAGDFGAGEPGLTILDNDAALYSILGTGAKEEQPRKWDYVANPLPNAKTNLLAAWGYPDPQPGHLFFYLAAASEAATGSTNLNIELNKNDPSQTFTSDPPASEPVIKRSANDVLLQFDWTGGGGAKLIMCRWKPTNPLQPWLEGTWGNLADPCRDLTAAPVQAQAAENTATITNFLPNAGGTLAAQQFVEAAVDLTAALNLGGVGQPKCQDFGAFSMRTRTSPSLDASLKDVIGPYPVSISNCGRVIIRKETTPATAGTPDFGFTSSGFDPLTVEGSPDTTPSAFSIGHGESETIRLVEPGTNYFVTEDDPSGLGYDLSDITCTETGAVSNTATTKNVGTRTVNLKVDPGETIDCTFKNTRRSSIAVTKNATTNHAQDFAYTTSGTGLSNFTLDDDAGAEGADGTYSTTTSFTGLTSFGPKLITENAVAGWTITGITCTGDSGAKIGRISGGSFDNGGTDGFDAGDTTAQIDLSAGENVSCEFTNTPAGASLSVVKDASPDHAQDFGFSQSGLTGADPTFTLDDDGDNANGTSNTKTYSNRTDFGKKLITETAESNWTLSNIVCTGTAAVRYGQLNGGNFVEGANGAAFGAGDTTVEVDLQPGKTATCTYTNTAAPASLSVVKDATPNHAQDFGFAQSGLASESATFTLDDDGDNANGTSNTKTYSGRTDFGKKLITETAESNWSLSGIACTGTAAVRYGQLDAGSFVEGANGAAFGAGDTTVEVDLQPGKSANCTFTNTAAPASLSVVKDAEPNHAQDFGFAQSGLASEGGTFTLDDDGDNGNGTSSTKSYSNRTDFGKKLITETAESNWTLSNIACTGTAAVRYGQLDGGNFVEGANGAAFGSGDTTVEVDLQPGKTANCTFTNTAAPASLSVVKDADPNHAQDFGFTQKDLSGADPTFTLDDDGDNANGTSNTKSYSNRTDFGKKLITETAESNWTLSAIACTGDAAVRYGKLDGSGIFTLDGKTADFEAGDTTVEVDLQPGKSAECTYTNTAAPASLSVVKDADPNHAQDFGFAQSGLASEGGTFTLDDDGDNANGTSNAKSYSGRTDFGKKLVTETAASDWSLSAITCTGDAAVRIGKLDGSGNFTLDGKTADFEAGDTTVEVDLQPGKTANCTYTNTAAPASLSVVKDADPNHGQDFGFAQNGLSSEGATFTLDDDGDNANGTSNTKTYSGRTDFGKKLLTETAESNWSLSNIACTGTATVRYGQLDGGGAFTLGAGTAAFEAGDTTVEVDLQPGKSAECTYTNTAAPASVSVVKDADPNHAQDFRFSQEDLSGADPTFTLDDDGDNANGTSNTKTYSNRTDFGKKLITETAASDWSLSAIACTGDAAVRYGKLDGAGDFTLDGKTADFEAGDTTVEVDLQPGKTAECTYTNTAAPASLSVVKDADPNHAQDFGFAQNGLTGEGGTFTLDDDGNNANGTSNTKTYSGRTDFGKKLVTETTASDWSLSAIACTGDAAVRIGKLDGSGNFTLDGKTADFEAGDTTVEVDLQPGKTANCTFTNIAAPASLSVVKDADPNHAQDFGFAQEDLAGEGATFTLDDDGDNANGTSNTKSYSGRTDFGKKLITETAASDWTLSAIACTGTAAVRIGKLDGAGDFTLDGKTGDFEAGDTTVEVDLQPGKTATCTYTNTAAPASLSVVKDADPNHAQDFGFAQEDLSGEGATFTLDDDGDNANGTSNTKSYSNRTDFGKKLITETAESNWTLSATACTGTAAVRYGKLDGAGDFTLDGKTADFEAGDTTVEVDLQPGKTASCTFTNTAAPASLSVVKDADPNHAQDFGFAQEDLAGEGSTFTLDDDGDNANGTSNTKTYSGRTDFGKKLVTETAEANWTLSAIACTGDAAVRIGKLDGAGDFTLDGKTAGFEAGDTTVEVDLQPGKTANCTFTNTAAPASLSIAKDADPDHAQDFGFAQSGLSGADPTFTLDDDGDNANGTSNTKSYSNRTDFGKKLITETAASDWSLSAIACSGTAAVRIGKLDGSGNFTLDGKTAGFEAGDTTVEIDLQPGKTANCTFTNTAAPASLSVVKDADPNHAQDFGFAQDGLTGEGAAFTLDDDGDNANGTSNTKTYSGRTDFGKKLITETAEANWTLSAIACTGSAAVRYGKLDGAGDFTLDGKTADFEAGDTTVEVDLQPGKTASCTFTNTAAPASLSVVKDADPNHPQDFGFAQDGLSGEGSTFTLDDDGDNANGTSNTKSYSGRTDFGKKLITETAEANWTLSAIACTGDAAVRYGQLNGSGGFVEGANGAAFGAGDTTVEVDLQPGKTANCTYTNTAEPGIVVTVKDADPNHEQDFTFEQDGLVGENGEFKLDDDGDSALDETKTFDNRTDFGTKLITEVQVANWTLTDISCSGTASMRIGKLDGSGNFTLDGKTPGFEAGDTTVEIDLQPGKTASCTFTNTAAPASLSITKDADPNHPQDFGFTQDGLSGESAAFDLDDDGNNANGTSNTKTYANRTDFGKKVVSEDLEAGWTLASISCTGDAAVRIGKVVNGAFTLNGGATGFDTGDNAVEVDLQPGKTAACTFTNTGRGTVEIAKQTSPDEDDPNRTSFGFTPSGSLGAGFSLADDDVKTITNVPANDAGGDAYQVTEAAASGYRLTGIACTSNGNADGDSTNTQNGAGLSSRVASIRVSPGETVRCTFTNTRITSSTVLLKAGNEYAYHGDSVTYTFDVTNNGAGPLTNVSVSDDKCPNVTGPDKGSDATPNTLDPGETWRFTCTMTIGGHADGEANPIVNTATVSATDEFGRPVGAKDDHQTRILHPAIAVDKSGPATGIAGQPVTYGIVVTNPGDVTFDQSKVTIQDQLCEAPPALTGKTRGGGGDPSPATLDPGDAWSYSCTVRTQVGQTRVDNTASVTGTDPNGRVVTASDSAATTLAQPLAAVAPQRVAPGTARLSGATGCRPRTFTATVRGRQIAQVVWYVDGKKVKTAKASQALRSFKLRVNPKKYKRGVHRIRARVTFTKASGTKARNLRMAFQRCGAARRVLPRFTG